MAHQSQVLHRAGTILAINGHLPHYSDPFYGHRVSVVAFQRKSAEQLSMRDKEMLRGLGFMSKLFDMPTKAGASLPLSSVLPSAVRSQP